MESANLQARFLDHLASLSVSRESEIGAWQELSNHYTAPKRFYHNFEHLETLFSWADRYADRLRNPEVIHWTIWYHDIIYNARRRDNEAQSARLAEQRLRAFGVSPEQVQLVAEYIHATAQHLSVEAEGDLAWFLDFDLAILGSERAVYEAYAEAVRREYGHVPGFLYRRGRAKVLRYFLAAERLYRTPEMYDLQEAQARDNLRWELNG